MIPAHVSFRLSAQGALLTHVTPPLRVVSLAIDEPRRHWKIRFLFDTGASESQLEAARIVVTEILSDFPEWGYADEFLIEPHPNRMEHLEWLVYHRCEDEWVGPDCHIVAPPDGRA